MSSRIPGFIVNLPEDTERLSRIELALMGETLFDFSVISAVSGRELPKIARKFIAHSERWAENAGAIGCFLSHLKVWEKIATMAPRYCVVLEDDAVPIDLSRVAHIDIPDDADLVFINESIALSPVSASRNAFQTCIGVIEALKYFQKDGVLIRRNVGTYGYLITPLGARKLLDAVSVDFCYGHVDWRLIRYSVSKASIEFEFKGTELEAIVSSHHNPALPPTWNILKSYTLDNPLVGHANIDASRIHV